MANLYLPFGTPCCFVAVPAFARSDLSRHAPRPPADVLAAHRRTCRRRAAFSNRAPPANCGPISRRRILPAPMNLRRQTVGRPRVDQPLAPLPGGPVCRKRRPEQPAWARPGIAGSGPRPTPAARRRHRQYRAAARATKSWSSRRRPRQSAGDFLGSADAGASFRSTSPSRDRAPGALQVTPRVCRGRRPKRRTPTPSSGSTKSVARRDQGFSTAGYAASGLHAVERPVMMCS